MRTPTDRTGRPDPAGPDPTGPAPAQPDWSDALHAEPDYPARLRRAADAAAEAGLAGLLVSPGSDLRYLVGYRPVITERLTMLVLAPDREPVLVVPRLERGDAEQAPGAGAVALVDWADGTDPYPLVARLLHGSGRYGISDDAWAMHLIGVQGQVPYTRYVSLSEALPMLRAVKEPGELARLAAAGAAADAAFRDILQVRFAGRREDEIGAELAERLLAHGHERVEFTLVAAGPNGADPHHATGSRVIEPGDTIVLDFGGLRYGYNSDTSRTVHVGEPDPEVRRVHEVVRQAQQAAFEAVRPGVECQEIDRVARAVITEAGYGEFFIHRTGHGIGLSTHEPPYLVAGESRRLVPGVCFSIEPGIYLPGRFGVRIEDIVTVTEDGARRFNESTRQLQSVS